MIFDDNGDIWLRQSWLDTAFRCPERGRLAIVKADWDNVTSDSALIGTATHAAIEQTIDSNGDADDGALRATIDRVIADEVSKGIKWTKYYSELELCNNAWRCFLAWRKHIAPWFIERGLLEGARTEVNFKVPLYQLTDGRTVGITGTVDLVPNVPVLADWKTSSQMFRPGEKQRFAIQPTIYCLAAIKGGLDSDDHPKVKYGWPMDFHYGIAVRDEYESQPQAVTVTRTEAHALFALHRIEALVDLALNYGLDRPWPRDDDHFLCSKTWCPWWSICKGVNPIDDTLPPQPQLGWSKSPSKSTTTRRLSGKKGK